MANYINYGTQQVDQDALMTNLADQVQTYVSNQPWSSKKKERFMNAYSDIMSRGITGADNSTGQWMISTGGDQIEYKDKKDKEAYEQAAYFIQQQMSGLRADVEAKEEEKKNLPVLNNEEFTTSFINQISNNLFGGRQFDTQNDWNSLDERGANGLRASTNRANKLADELQKYSDSVTEDKYNFEGSPFKDINDFKTRLNTAITTLRNHDEANYTSALNAIGLKASDWFNDGSGDIYGQDNAGNNITYGQYNQALIAQQEKEVQQQALNAEYEAKANMGVLDKTAGIHSKEARISPKAYQEWLANTYGTGQKGFNGINNRISQLLKSAYSGGLDSKGKKELGNLLYYVRTNNPNYKGLGFGQGTNISDAEWTELRTHTNSLSSIIRENFVRLPWTTSDGRYTYADNQGNVYFLKPANHKKFNAPAINRSKAYYDYKNNFLQSATEDGRKQLANDRKLSEGFKTEDKLRMGAMAQDILGIGAAFAPGYGTAASAVLGLTSLGTNMAADIVDDSVSAGEVAQNAAVNLGLGVVSLVPGLGIAGKSGKWLTSIAKWAPRLLTIQALRNSPEIYASIKKAIDSPQQITNQDWKNIAYGLSIAAGLSRGARAIADHRKYSPAFKGKTESKEVIKTKSGKEVEVTKEQLKELNNIGKKQGTEAANKHLNEKIIKNPSGKEEVDVEFKTGRFTRSPKVKSETVTSTKAPDARTQAYQRALRIENERRKSGQGIYKFAPRFLPTSYDIYSGAANLSLPQNRIIENIKKQWNPISERKNRVTTSTKVPVTQETQKQSVVQTQEQNNKIYEMGRAPSQFDIKNYSPKAIKRDYKNIIEKQNFTNTDVQEGTYSGLGITFKVAKDSRGHYTLTNDVPVSSNHPRMLFSNLSKTDVKKKIAELVKQAKTSSTANKKSMSTKEVGTILRDLKRLGWLKQGGKITDNQIDNFLNQYK